MLNKNMQDEYNKRTDAVVNYILKHPGGDLSLARLAEIANYSPYHFQKVFRKVMGETPKQFIIRMRLENAAHFIIAQSRRSITEIALDGGFSSPSTFSRAFKNHFGVSADELRQLPMNEQHALRRSMHSGKGHKLNFLHEAQNGIFNEDDLNVKVVRRDAVRVLSVNIPLSGSDKIQEGFTKLIHLAEAYDLILADTKYIGIINPHAGIYQAAITFQAHQTIPKNLRVTEIEGGKFAVSNISGDISEIFNVFHTFKESWLSKSAYRMKHAFVFEILSQNPMTQAYASLDRELYVPVEPEGK